MFGDIKLLAAGYALIITYVCIVFGRMNTVQHRTYVSLCGILCIGLAIGITYGLCSYMQVFYGPVHGVLPFLLLGIGVDDMFVIVQAWETLSPKWREEPVHIKIANMMKDAGVSITVTSITDIMAFSFGASTILPALRSFCIWAAIGILGTFLYQATFFVACLAIDQGRVLAFRDACCFCYIHKDYTPSKCSQRSLMQTFFDKFYAPAIVKLPIKICIVFMAAAVLGGGIYGVINLEQDFDPFWFFPSDSYAAKYWNAQDKYFPDNGRYATAIYFGPNEFIRYADNALLLESVYNDTVDSAYTYTGTVDAWFMEFKNINGGFPEDETDFFNDLHSFLKGPGFRFKNEIQWENG